MGFVQRKGKQLLPTKDGINLAAVLPEALTSPALTAEWETRLSEIAKGEADPDEFMAGIEAQARDLVTAYIWLDLPTTAEQVAAAMGQIGVTRDNPWDYTVSGFSVPEGRHLAIPYDLALASGVNELNFLAARLEKLDTYEIGTLNAALQQKNTELRTISRIIDYPDNLEKLEATQEMMKAVNAYYRKHKTLEGCPHLSQKSIEAFQSGMAEVGRGSPFLPWQLSNNNANIRQVRSRIEQLTRQRENVFVGWEFDGGTVEINREANRLQVFFEGKPDEATRNILKENSFRWSPKAGAWQRQLNDNTFWVVDRISFLRPLSGEKPSELQIKARQAQQEKPSIRAQLKAAKEGQQQKPPTKDKSQDLEV